MPATVSVPIGSPGCTKPEAIVTGPSIVPEPSSVPSANCGKDTAPSMVPSSSIVVTDPDAISVIGSGPLLSVVPAAMVVVAPSRTSVTDPLTP